MTARFAALALCALLTSALPAAAQTYPTRAVTIIVTSGPGSLPDVLARAVGHNLSEKWKQPVVIENRTGASYGLAASAVAKAPPDGYTLIATELGLFTSQPHLLPKGRQLYDAEKDLAPISGFAQIPSAFIANPSLPANNLADLIKLAKAKPDSITFGTAGPGTAPHLSILLLERMAGIKLSAVNYRAVPLALNDVIAGHISLIAMGPSSALPTYRAGKLKILAIGSKDPIPQLSGVLPVAATVPGYESSVSFGLAAPGTTPADLIKRINADVQAVLRDPAFRTKILEPNLLQPMHGSPQEFAAYIRSESEKWRKVIEDAKIKIE